ncbi:hypothetical protein O181_104912 [Austropuccinia psidii MF-1]|uniref:HAT C-terminal dimerisation domain-containing protein n=1 Tax=Austropuccinia psidii MF-1 TaxID=1389203 RepID=A0A9Q3JML6_9BASI|nr:hypothetical protein [Austropuccinia psidii MF-1]
MDIIASKSNPDDPFINNIPMISMAPSKMAAKKKNSNKLEAYLNNIHPSLEDESIMDYWKRQMVNNIFPNLGKIAHKYLAITASSASVESVFSQSGKIKSPWRGSLSSRSHRGESRVNRRRLTSRQANVKQDKSRAHVKRKSSERRAHVTLWSYTKSCDIQ